MKDYALHIGYGLSIKETPIQESKVFYDAKDLAELWNVNVTDCVEWDESTMNTEDFIHLTAPQDIEDFKMIEDFIYNKA
jgi:hypothetical protein